MKGRIRIAAAGLGVMAVLTAMTSAAAGGDRHPVERHRQRRLRALDLLHSLQLSGGGSEADASSGPVSGSATAPTPATEAALTPAAPAAAPAAVVPDVTTVHTGEYWSGSLPVVLLAAMGLAGVLLIGRRRIPTVARSINPFTRRRGAP